MAFKLHKGPNVGHNLPTDCARESVSAMNEEGFA